MSRCVQARNDGVLALCDWLMRSPSLRRRCRVSVADVQHIRQRAERAKAKGLLLFPCEHADEKGICKGFKEDEGIE